MARIARMSRRTAAVWLGCIVGCVVGCVVGCRDLPSVEPDVCGNLVVDRAEDCDGFGLADQADTACGAPGTVHACAFICEDAACPSGWGCGHDGRCRRPGGVFAELAGSPLRFSATDLAVGDVDGDGFDDLLGIGTDAVLVRPGVVGGFGAEIEVRAPQPTGPAVFADFDGDDRLDALWPLGGAVAVMRGDPSRLLDPISYPAFTDLTCADVSATPGEMPLLAASPGSEWFEDDWIQMGDFDGNTAAVLDEAFLSVGSDGRVDVSVRFDDGADSLLEPVVMAALDAPGGVDDVVEFVTVQDAAPGGDGDGSDELCVALNADDGAIGFILRGDGSRQMLAPFSLSPPLPLPAVVQVVPGRFRGGDDFTDLVIFGAESAPDEPDDPDASPQPRAWLAIGTDDRGGLNPNTEVIPLPLLGAFDATCALWARGDLDGDGIDELVGFDGGDRGNGETCGVGGGRVLRFPPGDDPVAEELTLPDGLTKPRAVHLADVDGDGAPDAIVALAGAEGDAVAVYWNKQGELSADDVEKIHIEGFASLLDAAPIRVSDSGVSAIAILQTGALLLATANRGRAIDPPTPVLTHDDGVGLVIGDVDSDGVDDILVRIGNKLRVMRQLPAPPVGATALDAGDGAR